MIFLDSSYIISLIFENDKNHLKALQLKYVIEDELKIINNTVLSEVLNSLKSNSQLNVNYIIEKMLTIDNIHYLNYNDYMTSINIFNYYNQNINFSDCTIIKTMLDNNINNIISFDSDFEKIRGINRLSL